MRAYNFLPSEFALSDIALRRLRISRLRDLNDPFELLASNMEGDKRFLSGMASWKDKINEMFGLLCFSRSWENPVLWSHYGDKHHGICLGFDIREELVEPVRYVGDRIPVIFEDDNPENGLAKSFVLDLLRTKYEHWIYEEEVRVFVALDHEMKQGGSFFSDFSDDISLREVILGPLCEIPYESVKRLVAGAYDSVTLIKSRLALKYFKVVPDEKFHAQNS